MTYRGEVFILSSEEYDSLIEDLANKTKEFEEKERELNESIIENKVLREDKENIDVLKDDYQKLLNNYHKSVDNNSMTS